MDLNDLNEEQKLAVLSTEQANRIIAGAGTGKTRVITYKIAHLINNLGVLSYKILAVTFTNKATNEMKNRLNNLVGPSARDIWIYTYHAFCARVLRSDIAVLGKYTRDFIIIDILDKINILKDLAKKHDFTFDHSEIKKLNAMISHWKNHQLLPADLSNDNNYQEFEPYWIKIYQLYNETLAKNNMLDFDDLLGLTLELFKQHPPTLEKWQARFNYILVDEFQDTNQLQFELINLLVTQHQNLTVVGDPDQTIYSFRGAKAELILNFENYFANSRTFMLRQNYRSTPEILAVANAVIKHNQSPLAKELFTYNNNAAAVKLYHASSSINETIWIVEKIKKLQQQAVALKDIAILYRANYLSRELEVTLIKNDINYHIFGGFKFFERKEIKDVLAYLRALVYNDDLSLVRILKLIKSVGIKTIDTLIQDAEQTGKTFWNYLSSNSQTLKIAISNVISYLQTWKQKIATITELTSFVTDFLAAGDYLKSLDESFEKERIENIKELLNHMKNYDSQNSEAVIGKELLQNYLQEVSLYLDQEDGATNNDKVNLMTVHNAKGLEYDYVFIMGLNENVFPSMLSLNEGYQGLSEERRVFYVAITRAKQGLFLTYSDGFSHVTNNYRLPSRFIGEISKNLLDIEVLVNSNFRNKNFDWQPSAAKLTPVIIKSPWKCGDIVNHKMFGKGIVIKIIGNNIQVAFKDADLMIRSNHPLLKKDSS